MEENQAASGFELEQPRSNGNGNALSHMLEQRNEDPNQAAYLAGLVEGRETGYRQGYRDGFNDGCNRRSSSVGAAAASAPPAETSGPRLKGLPCAKCGCLYYSDLTQCPRCKTPNTPATDQDEEAA
jgi:hypothetical protein